MQHVQGLAPTTGDQHFVAGLGQRLAQDLDGQVVVVVNDQNLHRASQPCAPSLRRVHPTSATTRGVSSRRQGMS